MYQKIGTSYLYDSIHHFCHNKYCDYVYIVGIFNATALPMATAGVSLVIDYGSVFDNIIFYLNLNYE